MRELKKYFESRDIKLSLENGKVVMSGSKSQLIPEEIKNSKYLKIALLSDTLNYERPVFSAAENPTKSQEGIDQIYKHRA